MRDVPIVCRWDGERLVPIGRSRRECIEQLRIGAIYRYERVEERSQASHAHYYAAIHEAWANLPEQYAGRFPSPDHLRKFALIRTGYATQSQTVATTKAEATRMAAFANALHHGSAEQYVLVTVQDLVVTVWKPESQRYRNMNKQRFEDSKRAVLDYCAKLVGVAPSELESNAGRAA